ncbi:response regulator transcription factor [Tessaracoccus antarcticus]|uniref:DNA-binding response regulator n=1 Tax=Tessaracoccus antarcticus TaxID=2479848 RepID=A0A3M0G4B7_9ACTN|nr:response regulator transcription factor [Tessaracoccus antarcticus]RMB57052.1 DNA-binding response regulator [Tessaracoccus antarcticus]
MNNDPTPPRVLVVEDELVLAGVVVNYLLRAGFDARAVHEGSRAVSAVREWSPDVVVLDLGLPGLDGLEVCRQLRVFSDCYVIMLTARADEEDTLTGLSVGADDYMTKPFSVRELVARVRTQLRRPRGTTAGVSRTFGLLLVDPVARQVLLGDCAVELTPTEFDVLEALSARPSMAFSRRQLIDSVWGSHWVGDEHLVDVHIGNLRRKLGDSATDPRYVVTVRGHGYRMGQGS